MATLIYAHDEKGNPTAGDLEALVAAVLNGDRVRVKSGNATDGYAVMELHHLYVRNGHVAAETTEFNWKWNPDGRTLATATPTSYYIVHYSTTGACQRRIYNPQTSSPDDLSMQLALSWYIVS